MKIKGFLKTAKKNIGPRGQERKSNITDPQSAKMSTSHGVIQGYNGVAVVDEKHQTVVTAEAHGEGQEIHLLESMLESTKEHPNTSGIAKDVFKEARVIADAGYHSGASIRYIQANEIDAYVADRGFRQRDPAFSDYDRYKTRSRENKRPYNGRGGDRFTSNDFLYDETSRRCHCPAGNKLYRNGGHVEVNGYFGVKFRGAKSTCSPSDLRHRCLKYPDKTETKQVTIFLGRTEKLKDKPIERMKRKFDTLFGRSIYNKRIVIVEPVFTNPKDKGLRRFTLRGKTKVDTQWKNCSPWYTISRKSPMRCRRKGKGRARCALPARVAGLIGNN